MYKDVHDEKHTVGSLLLLLLLLSHRVADRRLLLVASATEGAV